MAKKKNDPTYYFLSSGNWESISRKMLHKRLKSIPEDKCKINITIDGIEIIPYFSEERLAALLAISEDRKDTENFLDF